MLWETKPNPFILKSYQHVDDVEGGAGILLRVSLNPAGAFLRLVESHADSIMALLVKSLFCIINELISQVLDVYV